MGRPKGSLNKVTSRVKETLQNVMEQVVDSIEVNELTTDQKLKLLQITSQYVLPDSKLFQMMHHSRRTFQYL